MPETPKPELTPWAIECIRQEMHKNPTLEPWADAVAAELATLRSKLEEVMPKWIPVAEKLPSDRAAVWMAWKRGDGEFEVIQGSYRTESATRSTASFCWNGGGDHPSITHWMPRLTPAPPMTETEGEL